MAYSVIQIKDLVKAYINKLLDHGTNMRWIMDLTILVVPIGIKRSILYVGDISNEFIRSMIPKLASTSTAIIIASS